MKTAVLGFIEHRDAKLSVIFILALVCGCSTVKKLHKDEYLLVKNRIYVNGEKQHSNALNSLLYQTPNSKLFGYPLWLKMYNVADDIPSDHFDRWLDRKDKSRERMYKWLSKKQTHLLKRSYVNMNNWIKEQGEPPVILNDTKTKNTVRNLKVYYNGKGFWDTTISYKVDTLGRKRVGVSYNISTGRPYTIGSFKQKITSGSVDSIYASHYDESYIKVGDVYDVSTLEKERDRIFQICRDGGIYTFRKSAISFDVAVDTISGYDSQIDLTMMISNTKSGKENTSDTKTYRVHKIKKTNIYIGETNPSKSTYPDSLQYDGYTFFYNNKLKFFPKILTNVTAVKKGVYSDRDRDLTYRQLNNLGVLKFTNIDYNYAKSDSTMISNIYIYPRNKYVFQSSFDLTNSVIQNYGITINTSILARNLFKRAAILGISPRFNIGFQNQKNVDVPTKLIYQYGVDFSITLPRIMSPFNTDRYIPRRMNPKTQMSLGVVYQKNIGLDKQSLNGQLRYQWSPDTRKKHTLDLINIQYIQNLNTENYFHVYGSTYDFVNIMARDNPNLVNPNDIDNIATINGEREIYLKIPGGVDNFLKAAAEGGSEKNKTIARNVLLRKQRLTSNNFILGQGYTFDYTTEEGFNDNNRFRINASIETSGNILRLLSNSLNLNKNDNGSYIIGKVPFSQYTKLDLDMVKYFRLSDRHTIVFHSFFGAALPYGNSKSIPFIKSYFAGGANDNRGWLTYSLGPGKSNATSDFNEANFKIMLNTEYRFRLTGKLYGALFMDAGNIWNILGNSTEEDTVFKDFESLKDIAISSGLGFRYDLGVLVLRLDMALKTRNPALPPQNRWLSGISLNEIVYNIAINYPF